MQASPLAVLKSIRKYFWIAHLLFLMLAALFTAKLAANLIHMKLETPPTVDLGGAEVPPPQNKAFDFYKPVLERDIFNSAAVYDENAEAADGEAEAEKLAQSLTLLGTVAWGPASSLAIIQDKSSAKVDVYHVDDQLTNNLKIKSIERGKVVLEHGGKEEVLNLPDATAAGQTASNTPDHMPAGAGGVQPTGANSFKVDSGVVQNALEDMGKIMRDARIVPHMQDGKTDGLKVYNIKPDSLFAKIGIKNGDIIHMVNGMEIIGPEQGLQAFETLRSEKNITVDITRRGTRQTINYSIQ